MRVVARGAVGALALALAWPAPARAASPLPGPSLGLWGQPGVVLVPTGQAHRPGAASLGAGFMWWEGALIPSGQLALGLTEGLELGLNYGVPQPGQGPGLGGHARYQLVRPSRDNPTAVALGFSLLGAGVAQGAMEGPQAFLVATRDLNWNWQGALRTLGSLTVGAMGLPGEGGRLVGAFELPLGELGGLGVEALGPVALRGPSLNLVAHHRPFPGWDLRVASVGRPGGALWDRELMVGLSAHFGSLWPPTLSLQPEAPLVAVATSPPASPPPAVDAAAPWPSLAPTAASPEVPMALPSPSPSAWEARPGMPGWSLAPAPAASVAPPSPTPRGLGGLNGKLEGPGPWVGATVQLSGPGGSLALSPTSDGRFQARALPEGDYRLRAWAPRHHLVERAFRVEAGPPTTLNLALGLKPEPSPAVAQLPILPQAQRYTPAPSPRPSALPSPRNSAPPSPRPQAPSPPLRSTPGVLSGVVLGPGGQPLRGAKVAIEGQELAILTLTGPDGRFVAADLPRGRYALTVSCQGCATQRLSATLGPQGTAPLRVALAGQR